MGGGRGVSAANTFWPGLGTLQDVGAGNLSPAEKDVRGRAKYLFDTSAPFRNAFMAKGMGLMSGEQSVTDLPEYDMMMNAANRQIGDQYGMAREQIVENTPVGATGVMQRGLQNAALGQAEQRGNIANMIANQLMQQYMQGTYDFSQAGLSEGIQAYLGNAANFASRWNAAQASSPALSSGLMDGIMSIIGGAKGGAAKMPAGGK